MDFSYRYLNEAKQIIDNLQIESINRIVDLICALKENNGRLFLLGVGGGAANATHAVNDFRKIAEIESYSPTDNVSELTARVNDEGWETTFSEWLRISKLNKNDMVFILSVGGGNFEKHVSPNLVFALDYAKECGAKICGIVGRDGGHTAKIADACIIIPTVNTLTVTPHTESFQVLIMHLIVSHPKIQKLQTKWESVSEQ